MDTQNPTEKELLDGLRLLLVFLLDEQIDEVDAGGFRLGRLRPFGGRQLGIDDRIDESRDALQLTLEIDLHGGGIERIEARFDGFADQVQGRFVVATVQQERTVAAHHAIHTVKEEAAEVSGRRELANVLDVALPAQQRRGPQGAVLGAVIDVEPRPQTLVQLFQGERLFAIQIV